MLKILIEILASMVIVYGLFVLAHHNFYPAVRQWRKEQQEIKRRKSL